jgi:alanine transaminase
LTVTSPQISDKRIVYLAHTHLESASVKMNKAAKFILTVLVSSVALVGGRLTAETISPTLKRMEYAVRGQVVIAADKINEQLAKDPHGDYPFDHIVYMNIGNPHAVGQRALTWPRQVLSLVELPDETGVDHPDALRLFPADAIRRAREIKKGLGNAGSGAYSHSKGVKLFREDVARFIEHRDGGVCSDPEDIFLSNGASAAIENVVKSMIAHPSCGFMIPIPQYPIYSAMLDLYNGKKVPYFLNEENCWEINVQELERSLSSAREDGVNVVGFVLINPGNPTGQGMLCDFDLGEKFPYT